MDQVSRATPGPKSFLTPQRRNPFLNYSVADCGRWLSNVNHHFELFIPNSSLQLWRNPLNLVDPMDNRPDDYSLSGRVGPNCRATKIYEGTNQVQWIVVARQLLK